ncbi:MAG: prepilin-type N-terminal cleavage/methylation domain-containing protein, partial [Pseudomonadota bacterium]
MTRRPGSGAGGGAGDRGLTLVELMVTLVIAGLVTSSSFLFFAGQRRVYDAQTKVLGVQQNLWGAMDTLTRLV